MVLRALNILFLLFAFQGRGVFQVNKFISSLTSLLQTHLLSIEVHTKIMNTEVNKNSK